MSLLTINPATGENLAEYQTHSATQIDKRICASMAAFQHWRRTPMEERARVIRKVGQLLREDSDRYSLLMTREMGKPITQARAEIDKCAGACDFYASEAGLYLTPEQVMTDSPESFVTYEPLGVVLAIMPWNFPYWQVFRFAVPALMAGNGALLKHAAIVSGCALAIESLFQDAGLPEGLLGALLLENDAVEQVVTDRRICAVTLTGSTRAGSAVAAQAGRALKKSVLELGGSDAYVVLADADLDRAAEICATSRMNNNGQTCIAAKRLIVEAAVRDDFVEKLLARLRRFEPGDPEQEGTLQGPMARADLRDELHRQVEASIRKGARCLLGGEPSEGPGFFYPATLLTDISADSPAFREELFGPVACVVDASDEKDAIAKANDSDYGLGAAVFTRDIDRGRHIAAHELEAGTCVVNDFVRSDPRLPFGGIKHSGYGRELSHFGIREFVNIKTVYTG